MGTGILKQIDVETMAERYYFVVVRRIADRIQIHSVQTFKPFELTLQVSELRVGTDQARTTRGDKQYEFNDDTGGLLTQLRNWTH